MSEKICKTCSECYDKRPVLDIPHYYCCIDGREVDPYDCCPLWGNEKAEEAKE